MDGEVRSDEKEASDSASRPQEHQAQLSDLDQVQRQNSSNSTQSNPRRESSSPNTSLPPSPSSPHQSIPVPFTSREHQQGDSQERQQQPLSPASHSVVEAFAEVVPPSVPSSEPSATPRSVLSNTKQQREKTDQRVESSPSGTAATTDKTTGEAGKSVSWQSSPVGPETPSAGLESANKSLAAQNWHQNKQQQQNTGFIDAKKQTASYSWFAEMAASLFKCLFGGDPSSSNEEKDPENPLRRKRSVGEKQRIVRANDRQFNAQFKYADNFIKTSKYTLLTFIPINLYQQFTRIANFYFLVLLFLQCIPQIASVSWIYTFFPLSFVLLCSAFKDGYDDLQRHRNDQQVNTRISYVVRNSRLAEEEWMHVKVGDIIRMENEHFIAADLLLLSTSEPHGICYIETAELDGETNLKTRAALPETVPLDDILKDISEFDGKIICEPPNNRLDHFEGRLEWRGKTIPLDNKNMLLRGCRLRNTRWCYGLVVFAGKDTKLMKNSGESPMKRTSLDRFLNLLILGIVLFLLAMCLICTLMTGFWEQIIGRHFRVFLPWDDIVPHMKQTLQIRLSQNEEDEEARTIAPSQVFFIAALQFFSYIILLNTVVPISLYISVEMIRLAHSKFINNDLKMYYEKTDTPARARTSTLNEELGQVQYVFSDKTGTLTQNIMLFKKCSINGRSYGDVMTERGEEIQVDEEHDPGLDFTWNRWCESNFRFYDKTLMEDTKRGLKEVHEFWRLLAICHTVMPERKPGNGLEYQAQSPDEAALTSAARNFGFVFKSRTPQSITVEVNGKEETYEMLHILDFDNVRKRMSVLVRDKRGRIKLYCKGADTMILDRLDAQKTSELLRSATHQHLDKFATDGLRTLCVAYRCIEPEYCEQWMMRLKEARLDATANKETRIEALYEEMECNMLLLGATAIEDKLQDGVPQTIATLATANIKLWVLTGDKTETAINIGYSCRLLTEEMREVFIIDGKDEKEVEVQLKETKRRLQNAKVAEANLVNGQVPTGFTNPMTCESLVGNAQQPTSLNNFYHNNLALANGWNSVGKSSSNTKARNSPSKRSTLGRFCPPASFLLGSEDEEDPGEAEDGQTPVQRYIAQQIAKLKQKELEEELDNWAEQGETATIEELGTETDGEACKRPVKRRKSAFDSQIRIGRWKSQRKEDGEVKNSGKEDMEASSLHLHDEGQSESSNTVGASSFYVPPRTPICELSPGSDIGGSFRPKTSPPAIITEQTNFPAHSNGSISMDSPHKIGTEGLLRPGAHFSASTTIFPPENGASLANEQEDSAGGDGGYALVINGDSLGHALKKKYEKTFLEIGCSCVSVICCRVTPLQKAQVVDLVKRNIKAVTLAIGDGANDVSMIRTAHIGVGISGQEGMQAVLSSDFSIGQFRYLERLLLVHGRWSYLRMCKFLRYFFYKNFAYTLVHFWYSFFCGFSAQSVYDPVMISLYNLFFTALPVLVVGIFDQDVCEQYSLRFPRLYIPGQFNLFFNMRIFIYSIIHGMISSLVLFFIPFGTLYHAVNAQGRDQNDYSILAFTTFTALVIVVNGQIAFDTAYWTWLNWFVVVGSVAVYFLVVVIIYQVFPVRWLYGYVSFINVDVVARAVTYPNFWLALLLICTILLLPVLGNRFFWFDTHPSYADRLRVRHRLYGDDQQEERMPGKLPVRTGKSRRSGQRRGSLRSGYAFSHVTGFGDLIAKGTLFKNLEHLRIPSFNRGPHPHNSDTEHHQNQHLQQPPKNSSNRRFSLLKPTALLPHLGHSPSSPKSPILLTPTTLSAVPSTNGTSSVTQFSPGSSNTTTITTLLSTNGNGDKKNKAVHQIRPVMHATRAVSRIQGRRGTVDSLVIEHLPGSTESDSPEEMLGQLVTQIPVNETEETTPRELAALRPGSTILMPLRVPTPELTNTAHSLVVNADMDEERPLPTNWRYNADGTLYIPELEQPPQPGTPPVAAAHPAKKKTFISKKRRGLTQSDSVTSSTSSSTLGLPEASVDRSNNKPALSWREAPAAEQQPKRPTAQQQKHRVFTGKRRKVSETESNEEGVGRTRPAKTKFGVDKRVDTVERRPPQKNSNSTQL